MKCLIAGKRFADTPIRNSLVGGRLKSGEYSPHEISRFEPLNRRLALAEAQARQRPGVRQPSGALEVVGGRKRQRAGALQDLSAVRTVHG